MSQPQTTEGLSDISAMQWALDRLKESARMEAIARDGDEWRPLRDDSIDHIAGLIALGYALRIAPQPEVPERVWIDTSASPMDAGLFRITGKHIPYVPEASVPKGREVWMACPQGPSAGWIECRHDHPIARRFLMLDEVTP